MSDFLDRFGARAAEEALTLLLATGHSVSQNGLTTAGQATVDATAAAAALRYAAAISIHDFAAGPGPDDWVPSLRALPAALAALHAGLRNAGLTTHSLTHSLTPHTHLTFSGG